MQTLESKIYSVPVRSILLFNWSLAVLVGINKRTISENDTAFSFNCKGSYDFGQWCRKNDLCLTKGTGLLPCRCNCVSPPKCLARLESLWTTAIAKLKS